MKRFLSVLILLGLLVSVFLVGAVADTPTDEEILQQRRQIAMDYMREMATVIWRATEDIDYLTAIKQDPNDVEPGTGLSRITLVAGRLYQGIPYSYSGSTGESFLDFGTDEDGDGIYEISGLSWRALHGNSAYTSRIGNDCSGALNHAWGRFGASNDFCKTRQYTAAHGYYPVGDYDTFGVTDYHTYILDSGVEGTEAICRQNGKEVMYQAYTQLQPADAIVQYKGGGHTMMIVDVDVVYTEDGKIDPKLSTVTTVHQSRGYCNTSEEAHYFHEGLQEEVYQICGVDDVFTFEKLYNTDYLPVTCKELRDPSPIPEMYIEDSVAQPDADTIVDGIISSNRIIDKATMTITDTQGKVLQQGSVFTQRLSDTSFYGFNMRQFVNDGYHTMQGYVNPYVLPAGTYHCKVVCRLTGGQEITVRDFDYNWVPVQERTVDHSGTTCPMCGATDITWEVMTGGNADIVYLTGEHLHYYLAEDISNTKFYRLSQEGTMVCLDLNGHTITSRQRVFEIPTDTTLNIMGSGTVAGANATTYKGAALDVFGRVNIFGGTYKLNKAMEFPVITTRGFYARVDMYDGVTVQGREDVNTPNVLLVQGIFNMHGGVVTGGRAENGGNFHVGYKTGEATDGSDTYECQLNMFGGTIQNGTATGRGGNVYVVNEGNAVFYEKALVTGGSATNGGNIEAYNGGDIIINGSAVTGGKATNRGGNLYAYGIDVMSQIIVNDALIENGEAGAAGGNIESFGGTVILNNSTIRGGKTLNSSTYGGNIDVRRGGTVTLNSGTVADGEAVRRGGNVCVTNQGVFIMNGGTVSGGIVGGNGTYGKSIFVYSKGSMVMNGGTVEAVIADGGFGNGAYIYDDSTLTIAGNATVSQSQGIYLASGGKLQVDNSFAGTAGVRWASLTMTENLVVAETSGVCGSTVDGVFTSGGSFTGTLVCETMTQGYAVGVNGQLQVMTADHTWDAGVYTEPTTEADGFTTYTCTLCGKEKTELHQGTKLPQQAENAILQQPQAVTVASGENVQFSVVATGEVVSYKWEYRKISKWYSTSMTGYNTDTLTVEATGARNGYDYRCVITFADGTVLTSEHGELTVITHITGVQSPNNQVVVNGYKGQFTAAAVGEGLKYRWYFQRPDGTIWSETSMEGCEKPTVYIESTAARNGYKYRCKITDVTGNVVYTEPATMSVLSFTAHPQETFADTSATVTMRVETSVEEGFKYEWYYSKNNGTTWSPTTMTGYNTDTLTITAKGKNGYMYKCILTGSKNSKIESKPAVLHVGDAIVINSQTGDQTVAAADNAVFTVDATNVYSYQWYYSKTSGNVWAKTSAEGNTTNTLTVAAKGKNGYWYKCQMLGLNGETVETEIAVLTVQ